MCDFLIQVDNLRKNHKEILKTQQYEHSDYPRTFKVLRSHCNKAEKIYATEEGESVSSTNWLLEENREKM